MHIFKSVKTAVFLAAALFTPALASGQSVKSPQYRNPAGGEFPILAWYSVIGDDELTPERYREMREAGFNLSFSRFEHNPQIDKALAACDGTGVKLIITSFELVEDTKETVDRYKDNPNLAGYFLIDEPVTSYFPALRRFRDRVYAADTTHLAYLNLFPYYVGAANVGTKTYEEYMRRFVDEVDIPMISYDFYPIVRDNDSIFVRPWFYENLETAARVARDTSRPFWSFCLATEHGPYPMPTAVHLRHEAFSALAYGAQGLQYFTYWNPKKQDSESWDYKNAPINRAGNRTGVWYLIRDLNREIQALSSVFLGAELIDVAHTDETIPEGTRPLEQLPPKFSKIDSNGIGLIVSRLKNGDDNYVMLVNRDINQSQTIDIEMSADVRRVLPDGSLVSDDSRRVIIAPGDYVLYNWK